MTKTVFLIFYVAILVCMALATIVERIYGTEYVHQHIYGHWWFAGLWVLLAISMAGYYVARYVSKKRITGSKGGVAMVLLALCSLPVKGAEVPATPKVHDAFSSVAVFYNGRVCPLNSAATDFVTKLTGKPSWQGYSADEIMFGWMIYYDAWEREKIIRIKDEGVQRLLGIDGQWASVRDFYTPTGEYKLKDALSKCGDGKADKALLEADEKIRVVSMFYNGEFLTIFPLGNQWYSPASSIASAMREKAGGEKEFQFIKHIMDHLVEAVLSNDEARALTIISKIKVYQKEHAEIPPTLTMEIIYNKVLAQRWVVYCFLTLNLLLLLLTTLQKRVPVWLKRVGSEVMLVYLTALIIMRWVICGYAPLSNGFETMQFLAWAIMLFTVAMRRRIPALAGTGPVIASFAMLVAVIASGSPRITPLMPALQTPLLAIHVMIIMSAYALFALQTLHSITVLCTHYVKGIKAHAGRGVAAGDTSAMGMLKAAVVLLLAGIVVGSVWAKQAWGDYWTWDPKETWALITLMLYVLPLLPDMLPRSERFLHWYLSLSFLAVLMTYLGVNYLLPGLHSYA